mmetsp:Transcript_8382/g.17069  ORF Transcript_8382/g.17069 Transcript_8382/m.17069 type:complete len:223 (-) Transcript_8382:1460-2128(-)
MGSQFTNSHQLFGGKARQRVQVPHQSYLWHHFLHHWDFWNPSGRVAIDSVFATRELGRRVSLLYRFGVGGTMYSAKLICCAQQPITIMGIYFSERGSRNHDVRPGNSDPSLRYDPAATQSGFRHADSDDASLRRRQLPSPGGLYRRLSAFLTRLRPRGGPAACSLPHRHLGATRFYLLRYCGSLSPARPPLHCFALGRAYTLYSGFPERALGRPCLGETGPP